MTFEVVNWEVTLYLNFFVITPSEFVNFILPIQAKLKDHPSQLYYAITSRYLMNSDKSSIFTMIQSKASKREKKATSLNISCVVSFENTN